MCGSCKSKDSLYPEAIRCQLSDINTVVKITGCRDGYVDNSTANCANACPKGEYGLVTFNRYGTIESTYCVACPDNCYECSSNG